MLAAYHHSGSSYIPFTIACYLKVSGEKCDGSGTAGPSTYTLAGVGTTQLSNGVVIGGKAYVMVTKFEWVGYANYTSGLQCTDVSSWPFTDCGYKRLYGVWSGGTIGGTFGGDPGTLSIIGSKIWAVTPSGSPAGLALNCFDTATDQACAGQPWLLPSSSGSTISYGTNFTTAIGNRVFVSAGKLWCFDTDALATCPGSWPVGGITTGAGPGGTTSILPLVPRRDSSGTATGACLLYNPPNSPTCLDFTGASQAVPSGLSSMLASDPVAGSANLGLSQYDDNGPLQYWVKQSGGQTYPVCYDWRTDAACAGFRTTDPTAPGPYAITTDRYDPACVWINTHSGAISQFNATAGGDSCQGGPLASVPQTITSGSCSPDTSTQSLVSLKVTAPGGLDLSRFRVTVRDSSGHVVAGYENLVPDPSGMVDVTGLTSARTGDHPTVDVAAGGATVSQAALVTADITYTTDAPQICVPLETLAECPRLDPGVSSSSSIPLPPVMLNGTSETTVAGTSESETLGAEAQRSDKTGCVGTIDGTVRYKGGDPVPDSEIELLAPDGSVLARARTNSSGRYEFPNVNPAAGYRVRVAGSSKAGNVRAQETTTIDFDLEGPAPPDTLVITGTSTSSPGSIRTTVRTPGPGTVTQEGRRNGATACRARTRKTSRARRLTLICELTNATRRARQERSIRIRLITTYRSPDGRKSTVRRTVRLSRTGPGFTG